MKIQQNKSYEDIPDMIGMLLAIHQREIDRIASLTAPTNADIKLSLSLMKELQSAYLQYRVLKNEIKAETRGLAPNVLTRFLQDNNIHIKS
jgi:hypothetical protein